MSNVKLTFGSSVFKNIKCIHVCSNEIYGTTNDRKNEGGKKWNPHRHFPTTKQSCQNVILSFGL